MREGCSTTNKVYLLGDGTGQLRAVRAVRSVGVDGNDEVWELPVDEGA